MRPNLSEVFGGTLCLAKAGLAEGTTAAKFKILTPDAEGVHYCIDGIMYHKADTDDLSMTDLTVQAANTSCLYAIGLDSGGNAASVKGTEVLNTDLTAGNAVLEYPVMSSSYCVIGYIKVSTTAAFTPNTTDLGAGAVTDTYYDVMCPPARPRTS